MNTETMNKDDDRTTKQILDDAGWTVVNQLDMDDYIQLPEKSNK